MNQVLRAILDAVRLAFNSPTANPAVTAFVASIILLGLLIILLGVIILLTPRKRRVTKIRRYRLAQARLTSAEPFRRLLDGAPPEETVEAAPPAPAPAPPVPARPRVARAIGIGAYGAVAAVLVVVAIVSGYVISGSDQYCSSLCHATVAKAAGKRHASCAACHETPGFAGLVPNVATRTRMLVDRLGGRPAPASAIVDSADCIACHADVTAKTVASARGVRMSHAEPIAQGMTCTECHPATGHSARRTYSMSTCVTCHGTSARLSECSTCHIADPLDPNAGAVARSKESSQTLGSGKVTYPVVFIDRPSCEGCHDLVKQCDSCHGTRMPHTIAFVKGLHAREAAFGRKVKCQKCHTMKDCSQCHVTFVQGHGPNWDVAHRTQGWNSNCVCHAARSGRTTPMCLLCHDRRR